MTSMLLWHQGFESVCPNSWVLVTATIGLKTKQKKAPKSKILILYPRQPNKYGAEHVGGARL